MLREQIEIFKEVSRNGKKYTIPKGTIFGIDVIEIQLVQSTRLDESDKTALAKSNYFINGK